MNSLERSTSQPNTFRIKAPAFCAALTRSNGVASDNLCGLISHALGGVSELKFKRSSNTGDWFVRVCVPTPADHDCPACHDNGCNKCDPGYPASSEVDDCDRHITGNHECRRCIGGGYYIVSMENGSPVTRGTCYRCAGKGHHTQADRARNLSHDNNFVPPTSAGASVDAGCQLNST